ncbi:MAG: hypothetical protein KAY24_02650 [Candidatus Eisenbacteria sp.]|nr:hypothetical protein [Candidatus Eisenbacteria bacterium]
MQRKALWKRHREILEIAATYGAKRVYVFGSVARGDDVNVVTEKGLRPRIRERVMREVLPL